MMFSSIKTPHAEEPMDPSLGTTLRTPWFFRDCILQSCKHKDPRQGPQRQPGGRDRTEAAE